MTTITDRDNMSERCECTCGKAGCSANRKDLPGQRRRRIPGHGTERRWAEGCRCVPCVETKRDKERRQTARRLEATASGERRGWRWTGSEMEYALRDDLTIEEIAKRLGRTYDAVVAMRIKCRHEPKYIKAAGAAA